jgi:hypothetical protein
MKFLRDIWRGEYSLAKVFWVYNILVGVISGFILSLLEKTSLNFGESNLPTALLIIFVGLSANYAFIVFIGIWRSANRFKGNLLWGILAKIHVVLGLISLTSSIVAGATFYPVMALFVVLLIIASIYILNSEEEEKDFEEEELEIVSLYD